MLKIEEIATLENFDEYSYLAANPDVAAAVGAGQCTALEHFQSFGINEGRKLRHLNSRLLRDAKRLKRNRMAPVLNTSLPHEIKESCIDFLTPALRERFNIIDTDAVSSNGYDAPTRTLIDKHIDGLVLDCGAGSRNIYYDNVVNFEIVDYPSTDVRGVGEALPFKDNSFDAVLSMAVLEHVQDPFQCAREILRVLKPTGDLLCCVPFLQPQHGYPHHYYNMTGQGLQNLFAPHIEIVKHEVLDSVLPVWTLGWFVSSWANGLSETTRAKFLDMPLSAFLASPASFIEEPFVRELSVEKNFELASATVLHGRKRT